MTNLDSLPQKQRINSIDILRGAIMLIMAIDHTRDFFHNAPFNSDPTDLLTTTPFLFFTRFITHFCAPNFIFLSGISAYIAGTRRTKAQLSGFLIKRGLWLIMVELVLLSFAFTLNPFYNAFVFQVLWAIGFSMVLLGLIVLARAPLWFIGTMGAIIFFGHDMLDHVVFPASGVWFYLSKIFLITHGTLLTIDKTHFIFDLYAVLPWTGVMLMGYVFGAMFKQGYDGVKRRKILLYTGLASLAMFIIMRFVNMYGDPVPWSVQPRGSIYTFISFFNVSKYPPSLLYLFITIGTGLIVLSLTEKVSNKFTAILMIYGNVPFFYYILHFYLLRVINIILFFATGFNSSQIITPNSGRLFKPDTFGFNLGGVYLIWLFVVITLYFPCRWFSKYKKTHRQWWLSYL